jgi:hypothetical protein
MQNATDFELGISLSVLTYYEVTNCNGKHNFRIRFCDMSMSRVRAAPWIKKVKAEGGGAALSKFS